jgi:hypothetical protein
MGSKGCMGRATYTYTGSLVMESVPYLDILVPQSVSGCIFSQVEICTNGVQGIELTDSIHSGHGHCKFYIILMDS